jgi:hypothetical protein
LAYAVRVRTQWRRGGGQELTGADVCTSRDHAVAAAAAIRVGVPRRRAHCRQRDGRGAGGALGATVSCARIQRVAARPFPPIGGCLSPFRGRTPYRVMAGVLSIGDHACTQPRPSRSPPWFQAMLKCSPCAWTCFGTSSSRWPHCANRLVNAIGGRLTQRLAGIDIDEPADEALASDLAPILAALHQSRGAALHATDPVST